LLHWRQESAIISLNAASTIKGSPMTMEEFNAFHLPALEQNQARHNLLLGLMEAPAVEGPFKTRRWTLGGPGACAIQTAADRGVVLGDVDEMQCRQLAEQVHSLDFAGAIGPDDAAHWFAARARELGVRFGAPIPQQILALTSPPIYPGASGAARGITLDDLDLFVEWTMAFCAEAVPNDPRPSRQQLAASVVEGKQLFWTVDGQPASMAACARQSRDGVCIGPVYTPPEFRGRGYAGSVTAALVESIYAGGKDARGKAMACLYVDLRNPYSNRCYAKIGFRPVCTSWQYARV
jgi:hypothetical protein